MGPLLSATIAKKKDPKKPGKCSITLSEFIPVIIVTVIVASASINSLLVYISRLKKIYELSVWTNQAFLIKRVSTERSSTIQLVLQLLQNICQISHFSKFSAPTIAFLAF